MKCLRAYYYFDLIRIFKRIPYFTEADEDASSKSNMEFTRAEIYDKIIGDLTDAYNALPDNPASAGRVCKSTAAAILAKVYAQDTESGTCDWEKVKEWAKKVIDSNRYSLYPECPDMAKIDNNNKYESILAISALRPTTTHISTGATCSTPLIPRVTSTVPAMTSSMAHRISWTPLPPMRTDCRISTSRTLTEKWSRKATITAMWTRAWTSPSVDSASRSAGIPTPRHGAARMTSTVSTPTRRISRTLPTPVCCTSSHGVVHH